MLNKKLERINNLEENIRKMENQRKTLLQQYREQERKDRTKRLCKRAGFLESILPDTIKLSDERYEAFVKNHIANRFGIAALNRLKAEQEKDGAKADVPETTKAKTETPLKPQPSSDIEDDSEDEYED